MTRSARKRPLDDGILLICLNVMPVSLKISDSLGLFLLGGQIWISLRLVLLEPDPRGVHALMHLIPTSCLVDRVPVPQSRSH